MHSKIVLLVFAAVASAASLPPPISGYTPTFGNLTCASHDDSYQTYYLANTVMDCATKCNNVAGCTFFNAYHDGNGKGGSTQLTCALFSKCLTADSAQNCGTGITDSAGYCKVVTVGAAS